MTAVKFLGICDRYIEPELFSARDSQTGSIISVTRKDIIGLKTSHVSYIYPLMLNDFFLVFCVDRESAKSLQGKIYIRDEQNKEIGTITMSAEKIESPNSEPKAVAIVGAGGMEVFAYKIVDLMLIYKPGRYVFLLENKGTIQQIGEVNFHYLPAPPLTEERLKAIKSTPHASKAVRVEIGSKKSKKKIRIYTALTRKKNLEDEGWQWYKDIPDIFEADEETKIDLRFIKESFHGLLGQTSGPSNTMTSSLYDQNAILSLAKKFSDLLEKDPSESEVQKFIENNSLMLSMFHPDLIGKKSPVGSKYEMDFTILNHRGELFIIEIEKPSLRLFTKRGEPSANVIHAFDQVDNWLADARENKYAFVTYLKVPGIEIGDVKEIRGVVIAGRSHQDEQRKPIEKLIRFREGSVAFYTYDDLLNNLHNLVRSIASINMT